ncbi:HMG-CoA reductase inhibitor bumarsin [Bienertia sinuspersici]
MNANGQSSQGGGGKNKRFWKKEEEEALIDCLLELSCDQQWKGEGGFKNGYLNQLELMLNTKFPGCGIKAIPHIESKFKWFKDKYAIVSEMVNKISGFQWDEKTSTIQCERQAYDDFCKTHPKAGGLWKTPFPYLSKLDDIFGVDRANGLASELPEDSIHNLKKENEKGKDSKTNEKKRATRFENLSSVDNMTVGFTSFMKDMSNHLTTIASAMSTTQEREQEMLDKRKDYYLRFSSNPSQIEIFFSSPNDEWKREVVLDLLSRNA